MTNSPSNWGAKDEFIPSTSIKEHKIVPAPFIAKGDIAFKESTEVELKSVDAAANIYFSLGDNYKKYSNPITISEKATLQVYAEKNGVKSAVITTDFYKIDPNIKIKLEAKYANQYNAGGDNALIDGIKGTEDFRTGTWQGYWNEDVIATVDLGSIKEVKEVSINFLRDQRSWIFLPTQVEIFQSKDGKSFTKIKTWEAPKPYNTDEVELTTVSINKNIKTRYIKVVAKKLGELPKWHLGYPHDGRSWIFIEEIEIK